MAKPASVPTWNTDGTNRTTPTGGQIATGIASGEAANSSRMNYLLNLIGQWLTWVDAGILTGVSFVSSGIITSGGLLTALAGLAVTGAVTISTTLGVTGLITATAGLTVGSNAHVTVSGTGLFKHGNATLIIPAASAMANEWASNDYFGQAGNLIQESSGSIVDFPILLPVGKRIRSITLIGAGGGTGSKRFSLWRSNTTSGASPVDVTSGTAATSTTSGSISMAVTSIDHVMLDDNAYCASFEAGDTGDTVKFCKVIYDQP